MRTESIIYVRTATARMDNHDMLLKRMMQAHQRRSDEREKLQRGTDCARSPVSQKERSRLFSGIWEKQDKDDDEPEDESDARCNGNRVMNECELQMLTDLTNSERGWKEQERRRQRRERERERERTYVPSLGQLAGAQRREEEKKQPTCYRAQRDGVFDHYGSAVTLLDDDGGGGGNAGDIGWEGRGAMQLGKDVLE